MSIITTFDNLNWADYTIVAFIVISTLISLVRGFVRESISFCTWVIAFWVAFEFSNLVSLLFVNYIKTQSIRVVISFVILFVIVLIFGGVINFLIGEFIDGTGLSGTDRTLGTIFGFARGLLLVALLLLLGHMTAFSNDSWWKESQLIPHFKELTGWIEHMKPSSWKPL